MASNSRATKRIGDKTMTREEAIIEAGIEYSIQNSPYCMGGDNFYEKARELNRNKSFEAGVIWADKNPKSPWISIKDDLPCNHEELLSKEKEGYTESVMAYTNIGVIFVSMRKYNDGWKWETSNYFPRIIITHWLPIPELPKE